MVRNRPAGRDSPDPRGTREPGRPPPGSLRARGATHDRHRRQARRRGPRWHAPVQPGRRPRQPRRVRRGRGLPPARRHRPRRVLGRQRPPGIGVLPRAVGVHAGRLQRPRDQGAGPGELRHAPARHHDRADGAAHPRRRDRRARPGARRRRPGHRVPRPRRLLVVARDHGPRRALRDGAGGARRRRGRRPPSQRGLDVRRRAPQLHRPARLPRRVRPGLSQGQEAREGGARG